MIDKEYAKSQYEQLSSEQLVKILEKDFKNYTPEALEIVREELEKRKSENNSTEIENETNDVEEKVIPMNWYIFYTYIRIPLSLIITIYTEYTIYSVSTIGVLVSLLDVIIFSAWFIGLHRRTRWGWWFNIGMIGWEVIGKSIQDNYFVISFFIMASAFWFLPNFIYFKKRYHLFDKKIL